MPTYRERLIVARRKIMQRAVTNENGCWLWPGSADGKGYGQVTALGKVMSTHRTIYEAAKGRIPKGLQIDHLCREPRCCNPDHLEAVTPRENTLRGNSPALARLRTKTHCLRGHSYTEGNTYRDKQGRRSCRKCRKIKHAEWTQKRRAKTDLCRTFTAQIEPLN